MAMIPIELAIARFKSWFLGLPTNWKEDILRFVYEHRPRPDIRLVDLFGFENRGKKFDLDLLEGQIAEHILATLLAGTIEVKTDSAVSRTRNVAIEYLCSGKPSGIRTSEAEHWAFVLNGERYQKEVIVLIKTERLKRLLNGCRTVNGGDNNVAQIYLLPVERLVE